MPPERIYTTGFERSLIKTFTATPERIDDDFSIDFFVFRDIIYMVQKKILKLEYFILFR